MINFEKLELFPKEIYAIEQFLSYEYYYETVKLWEELIQYAEDLLDKYSAHLAPDHRAQHPSHQADYVWGTIVLPNFKATLHHLIDGLDDLKEGHLSILRRMSSIGNDLMAQNRDYPPDWMDKVEKGASALYIEKKKLLSIRATNIEIVNSYYHLQRDYKELLDDKYLVGLSFPDVLPIYRLNPSIMVSTDEPIVHTGIYRSIEPYSACKFLMREKDVGAEEEQEWSTAPQVEAFESNPDNYTRETYKYPICISTTWILVERVSDENQLDNNSNHIKLTKKGGEKAGHTGYWTTPAQPNTRAYFKKDEILPTLSQVDWGEVYWYFDGEE